MFFHVTSTMLAQSGENVSFVLETEHPSLVEFHEDLARSGCVRGTRWRWTARRRDEGGGGRLEQPRDQVVTLAGIVVVQEFPQAAVEAEKRRRAAE